MKYTKVTLRKIRNISLLYSSKFLTLLFVNVSTKTVTKK